MSTPSAPSVVGSSNSEPVWLNAEGDWHSLLSESSRAQVAAALDAQLPRRRWFRSKGRARTQTAIEAVIPLRRPTGADSSEALQLAIVRVTFAEGPDETYAVPLGFRDGAAADELASRWPHAVVAWSRTHGGAGRGVLYDAAVTGAAAPALLALMETGGAGAIAGTAANAQALERLGGLPVTPAGVEQSNSTMVVGRDAIVKLYRKLDVGLNPEVEVGLALTRVLQGSQRIVAPVLGALVYRADGEESGPGAALAIAQEWVASRGDAWAWALEAFSAYLGHVIAGTGEGAAALASSADVWPQSWVARARTPVPGALATAMGPFLPLTHVLGQRVGQLHRALAAAGPQDPAFAPEPFTRTDGETLAQAARASWARVVSALRDGESTQNEAVQSLATQVIAEHDVIAGLIGDSLLTRDLRAQKIRTHGDLHLGQVLFTGDDFVIIDFEGEPARPLPERRAKSCVLRDVMGMVRSFDYAAASGLRGQGPSAMTPPARQAARAWVLASASRFLAGYLEALGDTPLLPRDDEGREALLRFYELEKVIYEVGYELNNRPDWVAIPLQGVSDIARATSSARGL